MAESLSAEQVREKHIRDMGPELGPVYNALMNDVVWVHAKWNQYRDLYRSPERVSLLNKVAGYLFGVIQRTIVEDVLLNLARLTDNPKLGRKENLTLQRLPDLVADAALASDLKGLVQSADEACRSVREWRNRRLAHSDLALAFATSSDPLPGVTREEVEAALRAVGAVLNRLAAHYWQSEMSYDPVIPYGGGADALVYFLETAMRADESQEKCLLEGGPLPDEPEPRRTV